jgi:hypothetical protein
MNIVITATDSTDLLAALVAGTAKVHNEREDGTLRRRHFLADGTAARAEAEWVRAQREGQEADEAEGVEAITPRSMKSIAQEIHISVAQVRRVLIDLAITEELEEADQDELETFFVGAAEEDTTEAV